MVYSHTVHQSLSQMWAVPNEKATEPFKLNFANSSKDEKNNKKFRGQ